jgi:hypothetical protein
MMSTPFRYVRRREFPPSGPHSSRKRYVTAGSHERACVSGSMYSSPIFQTSSIASTVPPTHPIFRRKCL